MPPDLKRPSLLQHRLRALFGVSARAEVIRLMIAEPGGYQSISELAGSSCLGKNNVADTLDSVIAGRLAEAAGAVNRSISDLRALGRGRTHDVAFEEWSDKVWSLGAKLGSEVSLRDFRTVYT